MSGGREGRWEEEEVGFVLVRGVIIEIRPRQFFRRQKLRAGTPAHELHRLSLVYVLPPPPHLM